jgi:DNA-entry nuclease
MKTSYRFFIVFLILFTIIFNSIGCSNEQKSDPSSLNDAVDMEALDKSNEAQKNPSNNKGNGTVYILNTDSKKIHYSSCSAAKRISNKNRRETTDSISSLVANGYTECGICMK